MNYAVCDYVTLMKLVRLIPKDYKTFPYVAKLSNAIRPMLKDFVIQGDIEDNSGSGCDESNCKCKHECNHNCDGSGSGTVKPDVPEDDVNKPTDTPTEEEDIPEGGDTESGDAESGDTPTDTPETPPPQQVIPPLPTPAPITSSLGVPISAKCINLSFIHNSTGIHISTVPPSSFTPYLQSNYIFCYATNDSAPKYFIYASRTYSEAGDIQHVFAGLESQSFYFEETDPSRNDLRITSTLEMNISEISSLTGFYEIITDDSTGDVNIPLEEYIELSQFADLHFHEHAYNAFLKHYLLAADHECETINTITLSAKTLDSSVYNISSDGSIFEFNCEIKDYIGPGKWFVIEGTDIIALCIGKTYENNEITSPIQTYSLITNRINHVYLEVPYNESIPMWELPVSMFPDTCTVKFCKPLTNFSTVNTSTTDVLLKYMESQDVISTGIIKTIRLLHDIPLYTHREIILEGECETEISEEMKEINILKESVERLTSENIRLQQKLEEVSAEKINYNKLTSEIYTFQQKLSETQLENKLLRKEIAEIRKMLKC